ncbi:TPA: hypothetical protein ACNIOI_000038 [Pseudomonas aeruginosa]
MSNCSHEAWDFGALQCPDCGAVKGHVADADYAKLEAEAQALREEVAALRMARDDFKLERDLARQNFCDEQAANYQLQAHLKSCLGELAELRARVVVVPERITPFPENIDKLDPVRCGWNACLDELARLNGLTVSEGLLRSALTHAHNRGYLAGHHDTVEAQFSHILSSELDSYRSEQVEDILQALLGEGKEHV